MLDILENSAAKSGLIAFKAPYVFKRDFSTNFSVKWMHKDIGLMLDSAKEQNVPIPDTTTAALPEPALPGRRATGDPNQGAVPADRNRIDDLGCDITQR